MDQLVALDIAEPPAVTLWEAQHAVSPLILAAPHAGRSYRPEFLEVSRLDKLQLRKTEDAFVDLLFQDAPKHGVPLLCANFPRAWVDVNREEWELDPAMFADKLPPQVAMGSARVAAGLGSIPRVAALGAPIYRRKLSLEEAEQRLEAGWRPYHRALTDLIERTKRQFGWCLLIDCHSMPTLGATSQSLIAQNQATQGEGSPPVARPGTPDIILGDLFGTACRPDLVAWCERELQAKGYSVRRNAPYAGGYVTRHYGKPALGVHVLQLELARRLYMNEAAVEPHEGFAKLRQQCADLVIALVQHLSQTASNLAI